MTAKNVVLTIIALAALGAAGVMIVNQSSGGVPSEEDPNRPAYLVCQNPECKHEFEMTHRQYAAARASGGPPECPECGQRKNRLGHKCENCARIVMRVGHSELPAECPFCGHDFVSDVEGYKKLEEAHNELLGSDADGG